MAAAADGHDRLTAWELMEAARELAQGDVDRALDVACFRFSALADVDHDDGSRADQAPAALSASIRGVRVNRRTSSQAFAARSTTAASLRWTWAATGASSVLSTIASMRSASIAEMCV